MSYILLALISCGKSSVIGIVNNSPIYRKELDIKLKELQLKQIPSDETIIKKFAYEKLNELIEREILITSFPEIAKSVTEEEIKNELFRHYSEEEVRKFTGKQGIKYEDWLYTHRRDALASIIFERVFEKEGKKEKGEPKSSKEDEKLFPYVEILHILTKKKEEAESAYEMIKKGEAFEEVAKKFSISPEGKNGGKLGPFFPGQMPVEFDVCFTMKEGEISPVIKSPYGYHIFKVIKRGTMSWRNKTREEMEKIGEMEVREKFYRTIIKELRKKSEIKVNFSNMKW